jgi:uncharacterized protein DUF3592
MGNWTRFLILAAVAMFLYALYATVRSLLRTLKQRRDQRHLDEAGLTAAGQVVTVEAIQRPANGAAGHPVQLAFQDQAGQQRQVRDTSGLGGYVVRAGCRVTVRYSPTDPDVVRVEEIAGPQGSYRPHPDGHSHRPPLFSEVLAVVLVLVFGGGVLVFSTGAVEVSEPPDLAVPVGFGVIGLGLLVGNVVFAARRARRRRRPREEAVGVVTDVWQEQVSTGNSGRTTTVHPFTVHFATRDGREVHTRYPMSSSRRFQIHQRVRVRYEPAYPPRFEVAEMRHAVWLFHLVTATVGVVFLLVSVFWSLAVVNG